MTTPIPDDIWKQIVEHSPLVSVDLIVEYDGGVVLGQRQNKPAKGEWFIPGGVVRKGESLEEAIDRIAHEELNSSVTVQTQLGVYEHFYESSEFPDVSKHYVPIAYVVTVDESEQPLAPDSQHSSLDVFHPPFSGFHEYVQQYLDDYLDWKSEPP